MRYDNIVGNVHIHLDTSRMDANLKRAQDKLDIQVLNDCRITIHVLQLNI